MAKKQSKAAFVRSLPATMSAKEVIEKAKAAGHKLSPAYVYVIRSKSSGSSKGGGKVAGRGGRGARGDGSMEKQFVSIALDLGFARAQQILNDAKARIQAAVR